MLIEVIDSKNIKINGVLFIPAILESNNENKNNDNLIKLVTQFEGFFDKAYKCPAGVWTIGYGTTVYINGQKVNPGETITREQAYNEMNHELDEKRKGILKYVKVPLSNNEEQALVSFAYNVGVGAFAGSSLLKKLNTGDKLATAKEFDKWVFGGGKKLRGLVRRRESEKRLFLGREDFLNV